MYVGIDVGGTKTLLALFDESGTLVTSQKFPTPPEYPAFMEQLREVLGTLDLSQVKAGAIALPGLVDRTAGILKAAGNLGWHDAPILQDLASAAPGIQFCLENDAKAAALHEAHNVINDYKKVVYLTVSTGIGAGVIINGIIDPGLADCEVGMMMLPDDTGALKKWETFASGKSIHERYGKLASEIEADSELWGPISQHLALGIFNLSAVIQPEAIIIGGGVGSHLPKFQAKLEAALAPMEIPMVAIPRILQAQNPEEAVIYGCCELARQLHENTAA